MKEPIEIFSKVKIVFQLKYDLGGEIKDPEKYVKSIKIKYPFLQEEKLSLEDYNISYLSIKNRIIILNKDEINLQFEGVNYTFTQQIKIYLNQGIISILLSTELKNVSPLELLKFYKLYSNERLKDLNSYLKKHKCYIPELSSQFKDPESNPSQFKFGKVVDEIRYFSKSHIRKNPYTYIFHNSRALFFIYNEFSEEKIKENSTIFYTLLKLNEAPNPPTDEITNTVIQSMLTYQNKILLIGDWASIFLLNGDKNFEERAIQLFDLAQTFWYVCQKWIFFLKYIIKTQYQELNNLTRIKIISPMDYENLMEKAIQINNYIASVHHSILEVKNVDLIFYNPECCKMMKKFQIVLVFRIILI